MVIATERLDLVLERPDEVMDRIASLSAEVRAEISPDWLARVAGATAPDPWLHGFRMIERATGISVGSCGFKGPPDAGGTVELAYGVNPDQQGRGYATESARGLADYALASGRVSLVCAHTQPTNGASERVLVKAGFVSAGEVVDPEDGLVRRWVRRPANG